MEDPGDGDQSEEESPQYGYFSDEDSSGQFGMCGQVVCDTWERADCEDSGDGRVGRTGIGESLNGPHSGAPSSEG